MRTAEELFRKLKKKYRASGIGDADSEHGNGTLRAEIERETIAEGEGLPLDTLVGIAERVWCCASSRLGVLERYLRDPSVREIMVNGPDEIFVEDAGGLRETEDRFDSVTELEDLIRGIGAAVRREINEMNPILDARLADGSRVNAVFRNVAVGGPVLTIRKFAGKRLGAEDLIRNGTMTEEAADHLKQAVRSGKNIFISGGTSSGKTTFLNALTDYIPEGERIIVIEDSRELSFPERKNVVQMECHHANALGKGLVSMDMLIRTSLRMRPDRIIVGEVRGKEVADMLQAMNTGHDGSISTGHGNSPDAMLRRLEAMVLMSADIPMESIRAQILEAIDLMIHLERTPDGRRHVMEISGLSGYQNGNYVLLPDFRRDSEGRLVRIESRGPE